MPSTSSMNKKLRCSKQKSTSKLDKHTTKMAQKPLPKTKIKRPVCDHSQSKLKIKRFKQSTAEYAEPTGAVSQSGNEEPGCSSMPATIENGPEVIDADQDQQSRENDNIESQLVIDMEAAQNHSQDNRNSDIQPQITSVLSLATTSTNQEPRANNSHDNDPPTSGHQVESIATRLYERMKGKSSLVATHPVLEKEISFENMTNSASDHKRFSVVQVESLLPFYDDFKGYVCVPDNWIFSRRRDRVIFLYPYKERHVARNMAMKEEIYHRYNNKEWRMCSGRLKYESDTFEDADFWIASRNHYGTLVQQNSSLNDMPSTSSINKKLRCSKQKSTSKLDKHTTKMAQKPFQIARKPLPKTKIKRPVCDHSQSKLKIKRFKQSTAEYAEPTGAVSQSGNEEPGCSSMPATIENGPEVIDADQDQQSRENDNIESQLVIDMEAAQNHSQDNRNSDIQPQITSVLSLATTSTNQEPRANNSHDNGPPTSGHQVESIATRLYERMEGKSSLVATHPVLEKEISFENMTNSASDHKRFSVVQVESLPFYYDFKGYVCVPDNWILSRRRDTVAFLYPYKERHVARNMAMKEEKYDWFNNEWEMWSGRLKYESDTFEDADFWIASRNHYGPLVQQNSSLNDMPSTSSINKKLRCSKQKSTSKLDKHTTKMAQKPFQIARKPLPKTKTKRPVCDHSQSKLKIKRFKQSTAEYAEPTGAVSQSGNEEPGCSSMPATIENGPEVIDSDQDQQSRENDNIESQLVIDMEADYQNHSQDNRNSNLQPQITRVLSLATNSNNQEPCANNSYDNGPPTSGHQLLESIASRLYERMKGKPSLVATHPVVEKKMCFENVPRNVAILLKKPPNSMNQNHPRQDPRILSTSKSNQFVNSGGRRRSTSSQEIQHVARINNEGTHNVVQNPKVLQNMAGVVSASQNLPSSSKQRFNIARQLNGHQNSSALDQRKQQNTPQPRYGFNATDHMQELLIKQRRHIPIWGCRRHSTPRTVPRSRRLSPLPKKTTKNTSSLLFPSLPRSTQQSLLTSHRRFLSDEEELQGNLSQGTKIIKIPPEALNSSASINTIVRDPRTQTHTVYESYERNEVDFLHDYEGSFSASNSGIEKDSDGMFDVGEPIDDAQSNNENESPGDSRLISQQQLLKDQLASVSAQIISTKNSMVNAFENLLSSIHEIAASHQMLLKNMEAPNLVENSTCQASTSRNVVQEVPLVDDEREFTATRSANIAGDQNRNDVVNGAPRRYPNPKLRLPLPPEYDPDNTRWTLKYYERIPGLVELMPHSNIYVRYGELRYFEQTSSSCPALAQKILLEVFNKKALSICSSMTEKGQDSSIHSGERPKLDKHGCLVLLSYVLEHGHKRGWKIDIEPILKALHDKIIEIRFTDSVISTS